MDLRELERQNPHRHPWELSRAHSLMGLVRRLPPDTRFADIGAGDLYFAGRVAEYASQPVVAVDVEYPEDGETAGGAILTRRELATLEDGHIDCVLLMDVLEHIEDAGGFLEALRPKLAPGAQALVTVPAHAWLFSSHDQFLRHFRRYSKRSLRRLLEGSFRIERMFYFYSSLVPLRAMQVLKERLFGPPARSPEGIGGWRRSRRHLLTRILTGILNFDFAVNRTLARIRLPFLPGLSLCAICRLKPPS